ncbi:hypothetical protein NUW54_g767 [Trametes sanguinea]|uniref:Uncharacterized protein n=2 Tax=Trametes sanguinea TaxID=158606 RepID=A0ACC1PY83_9APHY|nr:hypothetical protein NUW54_g4330 [Trametes sanguinea]KAJ3016615.1 hypothetical protein NUW54_g767 [Trametes sanguinea]
MNPVPRRKRLTKAMRTAGVEHLERVRMKIYRSAATATARFLTPEVYLPDSLVKTLLDRFALIDSKDTLRELVAERTHLLPHLDTLWEAFEDLSRLFEEMRNGEASQSRLESSSGAQTQSLSFEECCSQFKVDTATISTQHDAASQLTSYEASHVGWGFTDTNSHVTPLPVDESSPGSPSRKRACTVTPLRPHGSPAKRRFIECDELVAVTDKENVPPLAGRSS